MMPIIYAKEAAMNVALVTGVSSGIGNATARALVERGYRVFGTVRSETSAVPSKVERVLLDVRDADSIASAVREVLDRAGRIDLLVNNAGGSVTGAVEETSLSQARDLFDVNFFGAVRVTQAVLPAMRAQRSGRIIFISSVLGLMPAPFMGFYAASKHALEGLAESLDHETRGLGIRAVLVEPAWTRTQFANHSATADSPIEDYAAERESARQGRRDGLNAGDDPSLVAEVVVKAATARRPRLRYAASRRARLLARLRRFMPARVFDGALRKQYRLDVVGDGHAPIA
jgi:NAD(P)-dependent dehydrogenase (short-subunit alcohol dehydrogenase family)